MAYFIFLKSMKPSNSLSKFLCSNIHSSSHSCLPKFSKISWEFLRFFSIISVTSISLFILLNLEINFEWISFFFFFQPSRPAHSPSLGLPAGPSCPAHLPTPRPTGPTPPPLLSLTGSPCPPSSSSGRATKQCPAASRLAPPPSPSRHGRPSSSARPPLLLPTLNRSRYLP
jgi:hypothetical protein